MSNNQLGFVANASFVNVGTRNLYGVLQRFLTKRLLRSNGITTVMVNAFLNLGALQQLYIAGYHISLVRDLSSNALTLISPSCFVGVRGLQVL